MSFFKRITLKGNCSLEEARRYIDDNDIFLASRDLLTFNLPSLQAKAIIIIIRMLMGGHLGTYLRGILPVNKIRNGGKWCGKSRFVLHYIVLYCIVLYKIILYCIVSYCIKDDKIDGV